MHNIKGEEEEIPPLLQKLNISDSSFMVSEFARSKNTLRARVLAKVVKNCSLNSTILKFCNLALLGNKLPDIWSFYLISVPTA